MYVCASGVVQLHVDEHHLRDAHGDGVDHHDEGENEDRPAEGSHVPGDRCDDRVDVFDEPQHADEASDADDAEDPEDAERRKLTFISMFSIANMYDNLLSICIPTIAKSKMFHSQPKSRKKPQWRSC